MSRKIMKPITIMIALMLAILPLSACNSASGVQGSDKLQIVTTIFPVYDWTENVLGENPADAEVTMLLDQGVDLHSFQPTAADIMKISNCDVFIYVGGESDAWVADALKNVVNKDMKVVNLMEAMGDSAKEEEIVEGMQGEDEEDCEEEEEEGPEYDEHIWLSLRNAEVCTNAIATALSEADPTYKEIYLKNAEGYKNQLAELDEKYQETVDEAKVKTLLFGDRFPFRYMIEDYNLDYYAAFIGCSAETEASFETIAFLSGKVDELNLKHVMIIEGSDGKIASTIISNTKTKDQEILKLNSMQSVTSADAESGTAYLSVMEQNLDVLREALN